MQGKGFRTVHLLASLTLAFVATAQADEDQVKAPEGSYAATDEAALIYEEAQRERITRGLARQEHDPGLASIAQRVANYQAARGGMTHTSLGDNVVAYGSTPRGMVAMWLASSPHRAFVLGGSPLCGYGFARSAGGATFAAGIFRSSPAEVQDPTNLDNIGGTFSGRRRWLRRR